MRQMIEVSLDDQGRIILPMPLQTQLGLLPGMTLVVEKGNQGELWLRLQTEPPLLVDKQGVLVIRAKSVGDLLSVL